MVVAKKKDGKVRIHLDPQHLSKAIVRSHYPLPTIEEVTTRLADAKVFRCQNRILVGAANRTI